MSESSKPLFTVRLNPPLNEQTFFTVDDVKDLVQRQKETWTWLGNTDDGHVKKTVDQYKNAFSQLDQKLAGLPPKLTEEVLTTLQHELRERFGSVFLRESNQAKFVLLVKEKFGDRIATILLAHLSRNQEVDPHNLAGSSSSILPRLQTLRSKQTSKRGLTQKRMRSPSLLRKGKRSSLA